MSLKFAILLAVAATVATAQMNIVYEWKYLDYLWDTESTGRHRRSSEDSIEKGSSKEHGDTGNGSNGPNGMEKLYNWLHGIPEKEFKKEHGIAGKGSAVGPGDTGKGPNKEHGSGEKGPSKEHGSGEKGHSKEQGNGEKGHSKEHGSGGKEHSKENGNGEKGHSKENGSGEKGHSKEHGSGEKGHSKENGKGEKGHSKEHGGGEKGHSKENGSGGKGHSKEHGSGEKGHSKEHGSGEKGHSKENGSGEKGSSNESSRNRSPRSSEEDLYDPAENIPYDVDVASDGRVFVTVPRRRGVPGSVFTVSKQSGPGGPLLAPYPNWSWYHKGCGGIINTYGITIDSCNRLWILDPGKIDENKICPAKLLMFDLATDKLLKRINIPLKMESNRNGTGLLVTPVVQIHDNCDRYTVYMADTEGYGLVVLNMEHLERFESESFRPQRNSSVFTIAGSTFTADYGILGMALTTKRDNRQELIYRALSSYHMYFEDTSVLSSKTRVINGNDLGTLSTRSAAMAMSRDNILFIGLLEKNAIGYWRTNTQFNDADIVIVYENEETVQFPNSVKIIEERATKNETLVVLSNRYQKFATGTLDLNEYNFRILKGNVNQLLRTTKRSSKEER